MFSLNFLRKAAKTTTAVGVAVTLAVTALIKPWEGIELTPYYDVGQVLTVCYGHTGSDIDKDKTYTKTECEDMLVEDVKVFAQAVDNEVKVPISNETKAAFISFSYNVGVNAFKKSTLLRKVNNGDTVGACNELMRWVYVKGKKVKGLENRRTAERNLCLSNIK